MDLQEALSIAQRKKRAMIMRKNEAKIKMARKRAEKKLASKEQLEKRARKEAIKKVKEKYSGGKKEKDMSLADKNRLEDFVKTKKKKEVERLTKKLLKVVKKRDMERNKKIKEEVEINEKMLEEWYQKIEEDAPIKDLAEFFKRMNISNKLDQAVIIYMHEVDKNEKNDRMKLISDVASLFEKLTFKELYNHIVKLIKKGKIEEYYDPKK